MAEDSNTGLKPQMNQYISEYRGSDSKRKFSRHLFN